MDRKFTILVEFPYALPEAERDGRVPEALRQATLESLAIREKERPQAKGKNATPDPAPDSCETVHEAARPCTIVAERSSHNIADGNDRLTSALRAYTDMNVQTGSVSYSNGTRDMRRALSLLSATTTLVGPSFQREKIEARKQLEAKFQDISRKL